MHVPKEEADAIAEADKKARSQKRARKAKGLALLAGERLVGEAHTIRLLDDNRERLAVRLFPLIYIAPRPQHLQRYIEEQVHRFMSREHCTLACESSI